MTDEDRIAELLLRWEELREQGQEPSADDLCRDCPQLVAALAKRIAALKATAWMEGDQGDEREDIRLDPPVPAAPRTLAGRYRLDEKVAEGGGAEVWKAHDLELRREVAVKLPKRGRLHPAEGFVAEARRVARLKHPGVVPVFDVGRDGDTVFIVSEFVEGGSLAERIARERLSPPEAVRLVAEVAETLAYAHEQGFVHRDIKPGNILLDHHGRALLTDFGIARSVEDGSAADSFGTLAYMAPEQVEGRATDHRSDLYSLGVVLYEFLTGKLPHWADDPVDLRRRIVSQRPTPVRETNGAVPAAVDRICMKCLAKNPADRCSSAQEIARMLRLASHQKRARWAWLLLALAVASMAATVLAVRFVKQTKQEDSTTPEVRRLEVPAAPQVSSVVFAPKGDKLLSGSLDRVVRIWDVKTGVEERRFPRQKSWVRGVAFSPDGGSVFACCGGLDSDDCSLVRWDVRSGKELNRYTGQTKPLVCLAVSPDGRWLLSGGDHSDECSLRLWDVNSGALIHRLHGHAGHVCGVGFSTDGGAVVSGGVDGIVRLWSVTSGQLVRTYAGHRQGVQSVAISPNGTRIVSGGRDGMVRLWNEQTAKEIHCFEGHQDEVMSVSFSPDGRRILSGSLDGTVRLWDVAALRELVASGDTSAACQAWRSLQTGSGRRRAARTGRFRFGGCQTDRCTQRKRRYERWISTG